MLVDDLDLDHGGRERGCGGAVAASVMAKKGLRSRAAPGSKLRSEECDFPKRTF